MRNPKLRRRSRRRPGGGDEEMDGAEERWRMKMEEEKGDEEERWCNFDPTSVQPVWEELCRTQNVPRTVKTDHMLFCNIDIK